MDNPIPIHILETFPRRELPAALNRRRFFITLAAEFNQRAHQSSGASVVRIPALGALPDIQLMDFIPRILPDCRIELRGDEVWGRLEHWSTANFLFRMDALTSACFNQINGRNCLRDIAGTLSVSLELPFERSFALTRGMFLTLVRAGVCLPVNNPLLG